MSRSRVGVFAVLLTAAVAVTGCSTTVSLPTPTDANDPLCAQVTAYLPGTLDGQPRRWTDAQATGAWGDGETTIIVSCGVAVPAASELPCQTVDGIDWLIDDSEAPHYRFTTFGRTPAVEVYVDYDKVSAFSALDALSSLVSKLPKDGECTARPGATPGPTA
ncbi:DUF3515 family protein [Microbacterium sp. SORGH_AS_0888]|uniref:DUF3515 family protein n=1 Tax=Microbacterium sp. SORGH_AS_0888 TaxID=3041791 RepID=UPI0027870AAA|nr:DUF3515 family protein [Microbacterium sp. SORGH_AS_0888]MDQ1128376.1 hypothetical protein [Microbacterium sp. SORGH_AS_0888]